MAHSSSGVTVAEEYTHEVKHYISSVGNRPFCCDCLSNCKQGTQSQLVM